MQSVHIFCELTINCSHLHAICVTSIRASIMVKLGSWFCSVMEGEESLPLFSPELLVLCPSFQESVPLLPPIALFHGTADCSILCEARYIIKLYTTLSHLCVKQNSEGFWKLMEVQKMFMNIHCKLDVVWSSKGMMGVDGKFHAALHLGMRSGLWVQRQQLLCMLRRHTLTCSCRFVASVQHFSSLLNWKWFLKLHGSTCFVQVGLWYWSTCELCRILCEVVLINC